MSSDLPFVIVTDAREKNPFSFAAIDPPPATIVKTLPTGDYSLAGFESRITIERKSLSDLFGSCGNGRERFEREIIRMARFDYAAVVIEADWTAILRSPPHHSKLNPKTVYASIIAWSQRHHIHFWLCPNRQFAERTTYRILERYHRDVQAGAFHVENEKF